MSCALSLEFPFALQNLFLYGYGAIFNFLGILGTVVIKGMGIFYSFDLAEIISTFVDLFI